MAKKKVAVKPKMLSAKMGPIGPNIPSANTAPMSPDMIGANIGKSQQLEAMEQAEYTNKLRMGAKKKLMEKKAMPAAPVEPIIPPGTFQNVDGDTVVGDFKKYQASMTKKKVKVKKKS